MRTHVTRLRAFRFALAHTSAPQSRTSSPHQEAFHVFHKRLMTRIELEEAGNDDAGAIASSTFLI
jgi:hypothetical protein